MKIFIARFDDTVGLGSNLEEAYEDLKDSHEDAYDFESCEFYEAEKIQVEQKIIRKAVVVKAKVSK